ncbi:hypothetical protein JCM10213_000767 [Rhodosporidiobolus nylandii]
MPSRRTALLALLFPALLAFLSTTHFVRNIPFHLNPPSFPASFAALSPLPAPSSSASTGAGRAVKDCTVLSPSPLAAGAGQSASDRLAFCEDAIPFSPSLQSSSSAMKGEKRNLVLLSCDPNRKCWNTVMGPLADPYSAQGGVWVLDPLAEKGQANRVDIQWPALQRGETVFHPLGIDLVEPQQEGEETLLLAVNHAADSPTIEVFSLSSPSPALALTATHHHTLRHPTFTGAPNSLAVLPSSSSSSLRFFLSHDHRFNRRTSSPLRKLANFVETVGSLALSRVDYVEVKLPSSGSSEEPEIQQVLRGGSCRSTPSRIPPPSSSSTPNLRLLRTVPVPMLVDNLSILPYFSSGGGDEEAFTVLAAGHPSYPALLAAAHDLHLRLRLPAWLTRLTGCSSFNFDGAKQRGLSWAVTVPHPRKGETDWETVFTSHGRVAEGGFGGSTTIVAGKEKGRRWMVVAGLYEEGVKVMREQPSSG